MIFTFSIASVAKFMRKTSFTTSRYKSDTNLANSKPKQAHHKLKVCLSCGELLYVFRIFFRFQCNICANATPCNHQGKKDVLDHIKRTDHKIHTKALDSQTKINFCAASNDSLLQKMSAEVTMSVLTATENIP